MPSGSTSFWRDQDRTELDRNGILGRYECALDELDLPILSIEDGFAEDDVPAASAVGLP